jgi:hypothetical protein
MLMVVRVDCGARVVVTVTAVIPEQSNSVTARKARGAEGGRPFAFDAELSQARNVVGGSYNTFRQWRALATC